MQSSAIHNGVSVILFKLLLTLIFYQIKTAKMICISNSFIKLNPRLPVCLHTSFCLNTRYALALLFIRIYIHIVNILFCIRFKCIMDVYEQNKITVQAMNVYICHFNFYGFWILLHFINVCTLFILYRST